VPLCRRRRRRRTAEVPRRRGGVSRFFRVDPEGPGAVDGEPDHEGARGGGSAACGI